MVVVHIPEQRRPKDTNQLTHTASEYGIQDQNSPMVLILTLEFFPLLAHILSLILQVLTETNVVQDTVKDLETEI